jgi:hypothetical protein
VLFVSFCVGEDEHDSSFGCESSRVRVEQSILRILSLSLSLLAGVVNFALVFIFVDFAPRSRDNGIDFEGGRVKCVGQSVDVLLDVPFSIATSGTKQVAGDELNRSVQFVVRSRWDENGVSGRLFCLCLSDFISAIGRQRQWVYFRVLVILYDSMSLSQCVRVKNGTHQTNDVVCLILLKFNRCLFFVTQRRMRMRRVVRCLFAFLILIFCAIAGCRPTSFVFVVATSNASRDLDSNVAVAESAIGV